MEYKPGDYFGERALIKNEPRAANVIAKKDCVLVTMDRHSVKRMLGPLEELLKKPVGFFMGDHFKGPCATSARYLK